MTDCGCHHQAKTNAQKKILQIALALNLLMFIVGLTAGVLADSTALIADAFDMLADSLAYLLGLIAVGKSGQFKARIATMSGVLLLLLGLGLLIEASRRAWFGSDPESSAMVAVACLSLIVNIIVLRLLSSFRNGEVHLRATWIFTRADVVANLGVILSGILVWALNSNYPDLLAGFLIGLYVVKEATEILKEVEKRSV
jgi:cation diffusion facilitator family transporter